MKKKFHRDVFYYLLIWTRWFFSCLPYRVGFWFGGAMGRLTFRLLPREQEKTLSHLRIGYAHEKTDVELRKIGEAVFEHYGRTIAELALIDKIIPRFDDFVSADGYEHFDRALAAGKGVVVTIAHFGNWELMGGYTAMKGYPCNVVARKIYFEKYDRLLVEVRNKLKLKNIYRDESVRKMLSVLKKNGLLGFVVDQDVESVEGVFVQFFNRPAFTPTAPVRFAMASGAPIIPVFIIREGIHHRMIVEPPIPLVQTADKARDIVANTQKWVDIQEKYIRRYPHLWVWNHKRWKTQPDNLIKKDEKEPMKA